MGTVRHLGFLEREKGKNDTEMKSHEPVRTRRAVWLSLDSGSPPSEMEGISCAERGHTCTGSQIVRRGAILAVTVAFSPIMG